MGTAVTRARPRRGARPPSSTRSSPGSTGWTAPSACYRPDSAGLPVSAGELGPGRGPRPGRRGARPLQRAVPGHRRLVRRLARRPGGTGGPQRLREGLERGRRRRPAGRRRASATTASPPAAMSRWPGSGPEGAPVADRHPAPHRTPGGGRGPPGRPSGRGHLGGLRARRPHPGPAAAAPCSAPPSPGRAWARPTPWPPPSSPPTAPPAWFGRFAGLRLPHHRRRRAGALDPGPRRLPGARPAVAVGRPPVLPSDGPPPAPKGTPMTEITLSVPEIHCHHCKMAIEGAVSLLEGVGRVLVDVPSATVDLGYRRPGHPGSDRGRHRGPGLLGAGPGLSPPWAPAPRPSSSTSRG